MKFLLTNDDGIHAPGLQLLAQVAAEFGEVIVIAPDDARSGCGHQVSNERPLSLAEVATGRFACDGTPADCVRLGLRHVAPDVDWVLSGVNDGGNLGIDVYMSGTVAAVREALLLGTPGIALSQYVGPKEAMHWASRSSLLRRVLSRLLEGQPPESSFWNVNFPIWEPPHPEPALVECALDLNRHDVRYEPLDGRFYYRGIYRERPRTPGRDVDVCFAGQIALTRVSL
jgi:5'/3'-nucleotidase